MLNIGIWGHPDLFSAATLVGMGLSLWQSTSFIKVKNKWTQEYFPNRRCSAFVFVTSASMKIGCYEKPVNFAGRISIL